MTGFISVYMTVASRAEAEALAKALVASRLAACVNILPGVRSIYHWQGRMESGDEVALIAKSRIDLFPEVESKIKALGSYTCPCLIAWPIVVGSKDYLEWLGRELKE